MNTQKEYAQLKQQNRRRLIGAIVMVFLASAILILVLDKETAEQPDQAVIQVDGKTTTQTEILPNPLQIQEAIQEQTPPTDMQPEIIQSEQTSPKGLEPSPETPIDNTLNNQEKTNPADILAGKLPFKESKKITTETAPKKATAKKTVNPQDILDGKSTSKQGIIIQVGAFSDINQAHAVRQKLQSIGIHANIYSAYTSKGQIARVRVVDISNRPQAEKILNKIKQAGMDGIILKK